MTLLRDLAFAWVVGLVMGVVWLNDWIEEKLP